MTDEVFKMCLCSVTGHKLIEELPLHKIINHYTSLRHINGAWYGECTWCKKSKIMVDDDKRVWSCTGCDMNGDVYEFMKLKFAENFRAIAQTLNYLAKK